MNTGLKALILYFEIAKVECTSTLENVSMWNTNCREQLFMPPQRLNEKFNLVHIHIHLHSNLDENCLNYLIYNIFLYSFEIWNIFLSVRSFYEPKRRRKKKVFRLVWELFICYGTHIHHISNTLFSFDFARAVETNENLSMYPKLSSCNNFVRPIEEVQFGGRVALLHQQTSINHIIFWFS